MPAAPFDTVIDVINAVNVKFGGRIESLLPLGGQILSYTQAASQQMVNNGWRKLQQALVRAGLVTLESEAILGALPGLASNDPGVQMYVSWSGCFDGVEVQSTPILPQDLIEPIEVRERTHLTTNQQPFLDMDNTVNGMPAITKVTWNQLWQWRQNALYIPGALISVDLWIRYAAYFADFADTGDVTTATGWVPWYSQPIPIMRSFNALVLLVAAEVSEAQSDDQGAMEYMTEAQQEIGLLLGLDYMKSRNVHKTAELGRMKDRFTPGGGNQ